MWTMRDLHDGVPIHLASLIRRSSVLEKASVANPRQILRHR